jgi:hypothetical protein
MYVSNANSRIERRRGLTTFNSRLPATSRGPFCEFTTKYSVLAIALQHHVLTAFCIHRASIILVLCSVSLLLAACCFFVRTLRSQIFIALRCRSLDLTSTSSLAFLPVSTMASSGKARVQKPAPPFQGTAVVDGCFEGTLSSSTLTNPSIPRIHLFYKTANKFWPQKYP